MIAAALLFAYASIGCRMAARRAEDPDPYDLGSVLFVLASVTLAAFEVIFQ